MDDDRPVELSGLSEGRLDGRAVVPVDRADVLQAKVLEQALRSQHVLDPALHAVQCLVQRSAHDGHLRQRALDRVEHSLVSGA